MKTLILNKPFKYSELKSVIRADLKQELKEGKPRPKGFRLSFHTDPDNIFSYRIIYKGLIFSLLLLLLAGQGSGAQDPLPKRPLPSLGPPVEVISLFNLINWTHVSCTISVVIQDNKNYYIFDNDEYDHAETHTTFKRVCDTNNINGSIYWNVNDPYIIMRPITIHAETFPYSYFANPFLNQWMKDFAR